MVLFSPDSSTLFFFSSSAAQAVFVFLPTANQIMKRIAGQAHLHCTSWIGLCGSCTTTQGLGIIFDCPLDFSVLPTFFFTMIIAFSDAMGKNFVSYTSSIRRVSCCSKNVSTPVTCMHLELLVIVASIYLLGTQLSQQGVAQAY